MGRLRAALQNSAIDRLVQSEVVNAQRAVDRAIRACRSTPTGAGMQPMRLKRVIRDLARAGSALANVGSVASSYGYADDPDVMSEEDRSARFWAEQAERDAARKAAEEEARLQAYEDEDEDAGATPVVVTDTPADDEGGE